MRHENKSPRTEETYLEWLRRFFRFVEGKGPDALGDQDIVRFLSHLAVQRNLSVSSQKQALNALVYFYRFGLEKKPDDIRGAVKAKYRRRLPTVLTQNELRQLLDRIDGGAKLMAQVMYGGGLMDAWERVAEILYHWYEAIGEEALDSGVLPWRFWRAGGRTHGRYGFGVLPL